MTLAGGESVRVTFKLTKDVPRTYNIEVAGLKVTILLIFFHYFNNAADLACSV